VVLNPDELSLAESLRIREELSRLDLTLQSVCLNKARHAAPLPDKLADRFRDFPIFPSYFRLEGVHGLEELDQVDVSGLVGHLLAS
jgi:arsenite-transporting ATPase